jgi:hypothetical protein
MTFFLDIDGVMVPAKAWETPIVLSDGFPAFSAMACKVLNSVIQKEDQIIITSSHKSRYNGEAWKALFAARGIAINHIHTLPTLEYYPTRLEEINCWFLQNTPTDSFVIIDDDSSLNNLVPAIKKHLVLTQSMIGLQLQHIETIEKLRFKVPVTLPTNRV